MNVLSVSQIHPLSLSLSLLPHYAPPPPPLSICKPRLSTVQHYWEKKWQGPLNYERAQLKHIRRSAWSIAGSCQHMAHAQSRYGSKTISLPSPVLIEDGVEDERPIGIAGYPEVTLLGQSVLPVIIQLVPLYPRGWFSGCEAVQDGSPVTVIKADVVRLVDDRRCRGAICKR